MAESELNGATRAALDAYRAVTDEDLPKARTAALVQSAFAAHARRRDVMVQVVAFAAACAVGAIGFSVWRSGRVAAPQAPRVEGVEVVQAMGAVQWHWQGRVVRVEAGTVRVTAERSLRVATPELDEALLRGAVARFELTEGATQISVESGEVTWRSGARRGQVQAGTSVRVESALPALKVPAEGPKLEGCANDAAYEACLARVAEGEDLAAQTALFELGTRAHHRGEFGRAIDAFRVSVTRFPGGVFAPEASIALMLELRRTGDSRGASEEAARFLERHPHDPRAEQVEQLR